MAVEKLESRQLLTASVLDTSFLSAGTLPTGANSLTVQFSEPVLGGTLLSNYELRRAGSDGLLGSSDDPFVPLTSVAIVANTATLNFAALADDVHRLTVRDTITDASGNALDGDGNGNAGGNWRRDFVVQELLAKVTSIQATNFDVGLKEYGAGQLLQGPSAAFDGLNRLAINQNAYQGSATLINGTSTDRTEKSMQILGLAAPSGYTSVVSQTVEVSAAEAGEHAFQFSASVFGGSNPRFRYLVNGVAGETSTYGSLKGDSLLRTDDGWSSVIVPSSLNLPAGRHVIQVEVWNDSTTSGLELRNVFLQTQGLNIISGQAAGSMQSVRDNVLTPKSVTLANGWTTVSSLTTTVDAAKTGEYVLTFSTSALGSVGSHTGLRYMIDGVASGVGGTFLGSNIFAQTSNNWTMLDLVRELQLSPGTHTIAVQARTDTGTVTIQNSYMQLLGYNNINGQPTATVDSVEDVTSVTSISAASGAITVASLPVTVGAANTGEFLLTFSATGSGTSGSVRIRYLVDGVPSGTATSGSGLSADAIASLPGGFIPFNLSQRLLLTPGAHTVSVQLAIDSGTLDLRQRYLQLVRSNVVSGQSAVAIRSTDRTEKSMQILGLAAPSGYTSVVSQTVEVSAAEAGEHAFQFSASVFGGSNPRFRYLVNGVAGETSTYGSLKGDSLLRTDDGWSSVIVPSSLNLPAGRHVIQVEVWNDSTTSGLELRNVFLQTQGLNIISGQAAGSMQSVRDNVLTPKSVTLANGWTTVSSLTTTVDAAKTGEYVLTFSTSALGSVGSHTGLRYMIDGVASGVGGTFLGSNIFAQTSNNWTMLDLVRELQLSPGTHTIAVQARTDTGTVTIQNSYMQLLGYNNINGQPTATVDSVEDVTSVTSISAASGAITVASLPVTVGAANTGEFLLTFSATGSGTSGSVRIRYLVDGVPSGTATSGSGLSADAIASLPGGFIPFNLSQRLLLTPGAHTVSVQLAIDSGTLDLRQRYLQLVRSNVVSGQSAVAIRSTDRTEKSMQILGLAAPSGYTSVVSQTVEVSAAEAGEHAFQFSASVFGGSNPRFRYLVNGVAGETSTYGSLKGDSLLRTDDGWSSVIVPSSLNLPAGRHVIQVEVWNDSTTSGLELRNVFLQTQGLNIISGQAAGSMQSVRDNVLTPKSVTLANGWTTVSSLTTTVDAAKTGEYVLTFSTSALGSVGSHTGLRYMIDGVASGVGGTFLGSNIFAQTSNNWTMLDLVRELQLSPGTHTIAVQARTDTGTVTIQNSYMQLLGYNNINGQPTATVDSVEDVTSVTSISAASGAITVASLPVTVGAANTGEFLLTFSATGSGTSGSVRIRYLVDGVPSGTATSGSGLSADAIASLSGGFIPFNLSQRLLLSPGAHTVSVQLAIDSGTLDLRQRYLQLVKFSSTYSASERELSYDSRSMTGVLVSREVSFPSAGAQLFARSIDSYVNPTGENITLPVRLLGNLGSDAATTVFATSDGDLLVEPTDMWFGTDDGDGTGTPALVHLLHGPFGQQPTSVNVIEDNVQWIYDLTVPAGATRRLAHFTVLGTTRADAIASANALLDINGFTGQAAAFLTSGELASLANFQFNSAPTDLAISQTSVNENSSQGSSVGSLTTSDTDAGDSFTYTLVSGSGDTDNGSFAVVGNQLRTAVPLNFESKTGYSVRVKSTDQGGLTIEKSLTISVVDLPELAGPAVIGDGTSQRSLVKQVVLTFDGTVTIGLGAFVVDKLGAGGGSVTTNFAAVTNGLGQTVVTLSFSGAMTRGTQGALTDGYYRLTVDGSKITRAGQALDSNNDGLAGDNYVLGASEADNFFALYGDINGDGLVGVSEFGQFRSAFGKSSSDASYNALFDYESDGTIGVSDFGQFRSRFGKPKLVFP